MKRKWQGETPRREGASHLAPLGAVAARRLGSGKVGTEGWKARAAFDYSAWVDLKERTANLPLDSVTCVDCGESHARAVRAHEMGHVAISPTRLTPADADPEAILAAEDVAVNAYVGSRLYRQPQWLPVCNANAKRIVETAARAVATGDADPWRLVRLWAAAGAPNSLISTLLDALGATWGKMLDAVQEAVAVVQVNPTHRPPIATLARLLSGPPRETERAKSEKPGITTGERDANEWAPCTIVEPSRTLTTVGRTWRPALVGTVRHAIASRLSGVLATRRARERGGKPISVLIDASGSMRNVFGKGGEKLIRWLETSNVRTCAIYGGDPSKGKGTVVVVSKGGRRASWDAVRAAMAAHGGIGNMVDGPALRWLAAQSGPRLWVCDGVVTGLYDMGAPNLSREALQLCAEGGITRVTQLP